LLIAALATDYDGTLATHGVVAAATVAALRRLKASGRQLLMVSGRELPDLRRVFRHIDLFDVLVLENGALLYRPETDQEQLLAPAPPAAFVEALRRRGISPLNVGRGIVATKSEYVAAVEAAIGEAGIDWRPILNKDSVMVLPPGVDKASGLRAGLEAIGLAARHVVGVGDAENDHAFLEACGLGAATANALPALKAAADLVTEGEAGAGVAWLIDRLLADEAALMASARRQPA
jgi:hydroxymethylpyrimidine pyrophosphatase-like HAD family hydrolase